MDRTGYQQTEDAIRQVLSKDKRTLLELIHAHKSPSLERLVFHNDSHELEPLLIPDLPFELTVSNWADSGIDVPNAPLLKTYLRHCLLRFNAPPQTLDACVLLPAVNESEVTNQKLYIFARFSETDMGPTVASRISNYPRLVVTLVDKSGHKYSILIVLSRPEGNEDLTDMVSGRHVHVRAPGGVRNARCSGRF